MKTQDKIRYAALSNGWTIRFKVGDEFLNYRGGLSRHDRDCFVIGSVDRHLEDGTPVTEPEHEIQVWYARSGAVFYARGYTFTVPKVLYHNGVRRQESSKADRIITALQNRHADIPESV